MAGVSLEITGEEKLQADLVFSLAGTKPESMHKLAKNLGVLALRDTANRFAQNNSPSLAPWRPHAAATIKRSGVHQLLRVTGRLRLSATPGRVEEVGQPAARGQVGGFESSADGAIRQASSQGFTIGSALIYARPMQEGMPRRTGHVKAHTRRNAQRSTYKVRFKKKGGTAKGHGGLASQGISFVKAHTTTLPAVPARPFIGFSQQFIERAMDFIGRWLVRGG